MIVSPPVSLPPSSLKKVIGVKVHWILSLAGQLQNTVLYSPPSTQLDAGRPELCRQRHTCPPLHGATEGGGPTGALDVRLKTNGIDRIQKASPSSSTSSLPVLPSPILPLSTLSHLSRSPSLFLLSYLPLLAASLSFLLLSVKKKKRLSHGLLCSGTTATRGA